MPIAIVYSRSRDYLLSRRDSRIRVVEKCLPYLAVVIPHIVHHDQVAIDKSRCLLLAQNRTALCRVARIHLYPGDNREISVRQP